MGDETDKNLWLTAAECASRMGLTTRALRIYENGGLIAPRRTHKNWRLYGTSEFSRLTEIIALKKLGLSLARITELLAGRSVDLESTLAMQQSILSELHQRTETSLSLISAARAKITNGQDISINELVALVKETNMTDDSTDTIAWRRYEQARPRAEIKIDPELLKDFVGYYKYDSAVVAHIKLREGGLQARLTGQAWLDLFPESDQKFFFKIVQAQLTFARDVNGIVTGLTSHQNGYEQRAWRIDTATAEKLEADLANRIKNKMQFPQSEAIMRSLISEHQKGSINYGRMSEELASAAREQIQAIQQELMQKGALQTVLFKGVSEDGCDVYDVDFENGSSEWRFNLSEDGKIDTLWLRPIP
jgi:DNA-binding transcriptional MerR regulator